MTAQTTNDRVQGIENDRWVRQTLLNATMGKRWSSNSRAMGRANGADSFHEGLGWDDTTLGGNRSINPRPQFTSYGDVPTPSLLNTETSRGMGRCYKEGIDNHAERIYMQFGVPAYNSLTGFFSSFYDVGLGEAVSTGKVSGFLQFAGKVVGFVVFFKVAVALGVARLTHKIFSSLNNNPLYAYYYMKADMHLYWNSVNTLVNGVAVNMGYTRAYKPAEFRDESGVALTAEEYLAKQKQAEKEINDSAGGESGNTDTNTEYLDHYSALLPAIWNSSRDGGKGGIDILSVATRYQRMANAYQTKMVYLIDHLDDDADRLSVLKDFLSKVNNKTGSSLYDYNIIGDGINHRGRVRSLQERNAAYAKSSVGLGKGLNKINAEGVQTDSSAISSEGVSEVQFDNTQQAIEGQAVNDANANSANNDAVAKELGTMQDNVSTYGAQLLAEFQEGSEFVSFIVNKTGTISETFSNSFGESASAESINSKSGDARGKLHEVMSGNMGDGIIANSVETLLGGAMDVLKGLASSVGLGGLVAAGGKAFVDIPDYWENAATSLPSNSFTMELRAWSGDSYCVLTNCIIPLFYLVAGTAARTTGHASYAAPFLCKLWSQGKTQVRLGMIDSLAVTRNTSNIGFNMNNLSTGIDVSWSVTNMSKMLHMPIDINTGLDDWLGTSAFDDETMYTDYLAVLSALSLTDQYNAVDRWKLAKRRGNLKFDQYWSTKNWTNWAMVNTPLALGKALVRNVL